MFLEVLRKRNPQLVNIAFELHQKGYIAPDSYIIDVDIFLENAYKILKKANENGIKLYYMLKQLGRNPYLAKELEKMGYSGAVVVDFREAEVMMKNGLRIGNIGHLVQIPDNMIEKIVKYGAEIITVYSCEKAEKISKICEKLGKVQDIMLKVVDDSSNIYSGQESGFELKNIETEIEKLVQLKGIRINGITSFPCFLCNSKTGEIESTKNVETILSVRNLLMEKHNIKVEQLNMPSVTSFENIETIKKLDGTHGEPGHSLTGTIPTAEHTDIEEIPAYVYVSEISHKFRNKYYCYGGGYYRRGNLKKAMVGGKRPGEINLFSVNEFDPGGIDYYLELESDTEAEIGDTVLTCFRTQIFVTRSEIVLVKGIQRADRMKNDKENMGSTDNTDNINDTDNISDISNMKNIDNIENIGNISNIRNIEIIGKYSSLGERLE